MSRSHSHHSAAKHKRVARTSARGGARSSGGGSGRASARASGGSPARYGDELPVMTPQAKMAFVVGAIDRHRLGGTTGVKSTVYRLHDRVLFGMVMDAIGGVLSYDKVIDAFRDELREAKVSDRSAREWLSQVKRHYLDMQLQRLREIHRHDDVAAAMADMDTTRAHAKARLYVAGLRAIEELGDQPVGKNHVGLRCLELACRMEETEAETRHRSAQTDKLRAALQKVIDDASARPQGGGDLADVVKVIQEYTGIKLEPSSREAA